MPTSPAHHIDTHVNPTGETPFFYTICPVLVASNIAIDLGLLDMEMASIGVHGRYLRSLENNAGWLSHFQHSVHPLFRDGGAITTIWARADKADTTLIASSATQTSGQIVVRNDASITTLHDLNGRRFGLPKTIDNGVIDYARAIAEQGLLTALQQNGMQRDDVAIIDISLDTSVPMFAPAANPTALWQQVTAAGKNKTDPEVASLTTGVVDAIFSYSSRTNKLVATGDFKVIADLTQSSHPHANISNGPYTMAIDTDFSQTHPDIVVAFLRAVIRAGQWIDAHRDEAAQRFTQMTYFNDAALIRRIIGTRDFVPNLSDDNLDALEIQKNFLRDHHYLQHDFSIRNWANDSFLKQAHASLVIR